MSSQDIGFGSIAGMLVLVGLAYAIPGINSKDKRLKQGTSRHISVANSIKSSVSSVKNSLASSDPIVFGKSRSKSTNGRGKSRSKTKRRK